MRETGFSEVLIVNNYEIDTSDMDNGVEIMV
jgi:hypothetical protein